MNPKTSPILWAWLAAILVAVFIFDLLVIEADDAGLLELLLAGLLSLAIGTTVLLTARALIRRR